jgi:hypothetical protein
MSVINKKQESDLEKLFNFSEGSPPSPEQIKDAIEQAKNQPKTVTYNVRGWW